MEGFMPVKFYHKDIVIKKIEEIVTKFNPRDYCEFFESICDHNLPFDTYDELGRGRCNVELLESLKKLEYDKLNRIYLGLCEEYNEEYQSEYKNRIERWAVSDKVKETDLEKMNSYDELFALVDGNEAVVVYRNGEVSNRYFDGTVGISQKDKAIAEHTDNVFEVIDDEVVECVWVDVEVDDSGNYIRLIDKNKKRIYRESKSDLINIASGYFLQNRYADKDNLY
jgi:hypothetical protein